jgi:hypothetical protein
MRILESLRIGEDWAIPAHERVQAAEIPNELVAGRRCRWYAFPRIIGAPISRRSTGSSAFTVASVPTAMNAGVSTAPCDVTNVPARAEPSSPLIENSKENSNGVTLSRGA